MTEAMRRSGIDRSCGSSVLCADSQYPENELYVEYYLQKLE